MAFRTLATESGWDDSVEIFAAALRTRVDARDRLALSEVDALVTALNDMWAFPITRPFERRETDSRWCPTWWLTPITDDHGGPGGPNMHMHHCQLEVHHAAPHVFLATGSVRLGHEKDLQHIRPETVMYHLTNRLPRLTWLFDGYQDFIAAHWWWHLARVHDCHMCAICPREVW